MRIVQGEGEGIIAHARNAARALVCLFVPWSGPAVLSRAAFEQAAELLDRARPPLGVACFLIDEPDSATWDWLVSVQPPTPIGLLAAGYGPLLWLRNGEVLHAVGRGDQITAEEIVAHCQALWGAAQEEAPA